MGLFCCTLGLKYAAKFLKCLGHFGLKDYDNVLGNHYDFLKFGRLVGY